jgi:hypothetical protein
MRAAWAENGIVDRALVVGRLPGLYTVRVDRRGNGDSRTGAANPPPDPCSPARSGRPGSTPTSNSLHSRPPPSPRGSPPSSSHTPGRSARGATHCSRALPRAPASRFLPVTEGNAAATHPSGARWSTTCTGLPSSPGHRSAVACATRSPVSSSVPSPVPPRPWRPEPARCRLPGARSARSPPRRRRSIVAAPGYRCRAGVARGRRPRTVGGLPRRALGARRQRSRPSWTSGSAPPRRRPSASPERCVPARSRSRPRR